MSYGQQSSNSQSERGLPGIYRVHFLNESIPEFGYVQNLSHGAAADPSGSRFMTQVDRMLPVGKYGLHPNMDMAVGQIGRDMFSNASASRTLRGFNNANNLEAVTGDAVRMASPVLAPLVSQYALDRANMAPKLQQLSVGYGTTPMNILQNLIGGSGTSSSTSGGFGFDISELLKAAGAGAAASDRRLKSNIIKLGTHPLGIGWYEYDIEGRREQGVMAQELLEVMPEAVTIMDNGYYGVYYDMIGRL